LKIPEVSTIGVLGGGLMGHGLALEFARAGYQVRIYDSIAAQRDSAPERLRGAYKTMSDMGMADAAEADETMDRIKVVDSMEELGASAEYILEAVTEDIDIKKAAFAELDQVCGPDVIFASNTSALSPTELGSSTNRPEKVVVTHFFIPPYLLPLVEVVPGEKTDPTTVDLAARICESIGKTAIRLSREVQGFVVNRLQFAMFREALSLVQNGIVSPEDVDKATTMSWGNRLGVFGPFKIADIAGLDTYDFVCKTIFPTLGTDHDVARFFADKVASGKLGAKTGEGIYQWPEGALDDARAQIARHALFTFGGGDPD
jgi:3-hydroxybutyryl-CoA dehydrogenase